MCSGLGLGNAAAAVAQGVVLDAGGLINRIRQAARTARENKEDCYHLARRVDILAELLPCLRQHDPVALRLLAGLEDTLSEVRDLVMSCHIQGMGRNTATFRDVKRKVDSYICLFQLIIHIGITRRLENYTSVSESHQLESSGGDDQLALAEITAATRGVGGGGTVFWSYRHQQSESRCYSSISSSSGTIVSTIYTPNTSRLSSLSMEAAAMLLNLEIHGDDNMSCREETEGDDEQMKHIKSTVHEFSDAPPPANCGSIKGGSNMSVLERWFTELGVAWVLHLSADDGASASAGRELEYTSSWIRGLKEITKAINSTASLISRGVSLGMPTIIQLLIQLARYAKEAMLKMLVFVDVAVQLSYGMPAPYKKQVLELLVVCGALSEVLSEIRWSFGYLPPAEVERIQGEIDSLLSAKGRKASEAIWRTMKQIATHVVLEDGDDSLGTPTTPQGASSGIHRATRSVISYITFLRSHAPSADRILVEFGPGGTSSASLMEEMLSSLEEKLAKKSASFPDQSLRFLFLLNNSNFMRQHLHNAHYSLEPHLALLLGKVKGYMENYLQVSWTPVLSCLLDSKPQCFGMNYSPLSKFESEFQKTCTAQKLWKVRDPKLRKTLRTAIIEAIVPGYTKYIEDNSITTPKFTTKEVEEMLQELFEG